MPWMFSTDPLEKCEQHGHCYLKLENTERFNEESVLELKRLKVTLTNQIKLRILARFRTTKHKMLRRTNFVHSLKGSDKKKAYMEPQ